MKSLEILKDMMKPTHYYKTAIKSWGWEYWFENNQSYCGKMIQVRLNEWSSHGAFHYHKIKDETFLVLEGTLMLDILDLSNVYRSKILVGNIITPLNSNKEITANRYFLKPYDYLRIKPGVLHRFSTLTKEAIFTETSTTHMEEDSFRLKYPSPQEQLYIEISTKNSRNFPVETRHFSCAIQKTVT
jgi:quercetin dioxygenase-like cupin family protein